MRTEGIFGLAAIATLALASPGAAQESCARDCLDGLVHLYYDSMASHDLDRLPLTENARFTENGREMPLGEGLWASAGETTHRMVIADPEQGSAAALAVVREDDGLVMHMLRIAVEGAALSEIETLVCREGESDPLWDPEALSGAEPSANFQLSIRPRERDGRYAMIAAVEAYWRAFETNGTPEYVRAPLLPSTQRIENGLRVTTSTGVADIPPQTAAQGFDEGRFPNRRIYDRRYPVVDVERGVVLAVVRFGNKPGVPTPNIREGVAPLVGEFFQVQAGRIVEIQAVLNFTIREDDPTGW